MLSIFDGVRDLTLFSVLLRLLLSVVCGGLVGLEREYKRRSAGFRTHILVCLGAALTTLTGQFLSLCLGYYTDMARIGAQVVTGIGFIGAGTIIVTRRRRVRGLTTAAGLWASAIVGLALGMGFFEAAIAATLLVLLVEMLFVKLEYWLLRYRREHIFYIEFTNKDCLPAVLKKLEENEIKVLNIEMARSEEDGTAYSAVIYTRSSKKTDDSKIMQCAGAADGVICFEQL